MRRLVTLLGLLALLAFSGAAMVVALPGASTAAAATCTTAYGGPASGDGWTATEQLSRHYFDANGAAARTQNCFKLAVNKHTDLQDHERITVSWSGAHTTGGRSLNPYGETGLPQEYPVLMMECRGVDPKDGAVSTGATQVAPDTCWTNTFSQRTSSAIPGTGIWEQDADSTPPDDTAHIQGIDPKQIDKSCNVNDESDDLITPFLAADKTLYSGCSSQSMPPEATVNSVSIPNEVAAFTSSNGTGTFQFEVRTSLENQSLGCSSTVPCTLEVIPIDGIDCDNPDPAAACNETGTLNPGSVNTGEAPEDAVAPAFWASASNWNRRVPVPLNFAPPPSVCDIASAGKPVPFFGSELLDQAALQWAPAYCLNKNRFNWQDNAQSDDGAFTLMQAGQAAAAEVSERGSDDTGIGYAPTAATGWAIAFDIDKANNGAQATTLKLNALLLAKLLTESYPGSPDLARAHPGLSENPLSLNQDPEFQRLNPGLDTSHFNEAAATLLATSTSSQAMYELTSYIASDPAAMAFINGKTDVEITSDGSSEYDTKVNPAYKGLKLPVSTWPLLDTYQFKTVSNPCLQAEGATMPPYLPLVANPQISMQLDAQALLYNWPQVETGCTGAAGSTDNPLQLGRVGPEGVGNRFMLALVTLGDAQRYGLTTASLQAAPNHYVAATSAGIRAAIALSKKSSNLRPFTLTQAQIRKSTTAYPGTMVVYTAAKTHGLPATTAKDVAQFIRVSSTQGQVPGRGNGQLAAGYVPIVNSGVTKGLYVQARQVANAVAAQKAPAHAQPTAVKAPPTGPGTTSPSSPSTVPAGPPTDLPTSASPPGPAPAGPMPSAGATPAVDAPSGTTPVAATSQSTNPLTSGAGGVVLLILLGLGVFAGIGTVGGRVLLRIKGLR